MTWLLVIITAGTIASTPMRDRDTCQARAAEVRAAALVTYTKAGCLRVRR